MKTIVAVSAIIHHDHKFLCVQKGANKYDYIAYKYEFPGGKVEEGETNEEAVIREIREELKMDIAIVSSLSSVTHQYPDFLLVLHNFLCSCNSPDFVLTEHIDFKWLDKKELRSVEWAASDVAIVEELLKPKKREYKPNKTVRYVFETTPERSARMSNIRSKNTQPEILLRKALWDKGIRYRLNVKKLPGKPDIVIGKAKLAIFIDGEFWHGYNWEEKKLRIKANRDYWIPKIENNMVRDLKNTADLQALGYKVLRFWTLDIKKNLKQCILEIGTNL